MAAGTYIELALANIPANNVRRLVIRSSEGAVAVSETPRTLKISGIESTTNVIATNGVTLETEDGFGANQCIAEMDGGRLLVSRILGRVRLRGSGELDAPPPPPKTDLLANLAHAISASINTLVVEGSGDLKIDPGISIGILEGLGSGAPVPLSLLPMAQQLDPVFGARRIRIRDLRNVDITAQEDSLSTVQIQRVQTVSMSEFHGPLSLELEANAGMNGVTFHKRHGVPVVVTAEPGSVITGASGDIALGTVRHVYVSAGGQPLTIHSAAGNEGTNDADPWEGLVLTGAHIPPGVEGRRILARMDKVYHFTPDASDVPGRDQTAWSRITRQRKVRYGQADRRLHQDAEYLGELARLSREKGAPGSLKTRLAWCAYRLRAIKAQGLVERMALFVYRLLGYGERPMPAFITWILSSLLLAGPVLAATGHPPEWSSEAIERFLLEAGRLALGPLAGLGRGGGLNGGGHGRNRGTSGYVGSAGHRRACLAQLRKERSLEAKLASEGTPVSSGRRLGDGAALLQATLFRVGMEPANSGQGRP